jgi:hypothetical protein
VHGGIIEHAFQLHLRRPDLHTGAHEGHRIVGSDGRRHASTVQCEEIVEQRIELPEARRLGCQHANLRQPSAPDAEVGSALRGGTGGHGDLEALPAPLQGIQRVAGHGALRRDPHSRQADEKREEHGESPCLWPDAGHADRIRRPSQPKGGAWSAANFSGRGLEPRLGCHRLSEDPEICPQLLLEAEYKGRPRGIGGAGGAIPQALAGSD